MTTALETSWKPIKLETICWPVYRLGERKPEQHNGLVFYHSEYGDLDQNTTTLKYRVVDDKAVPGNTLGARRLRLRSDGVSLFPIRTALYFLADVIKLAKSTTWFIDGSGQVFQYKKLHRAKLTTKRIKQVLPAEVTGCVLELEGLSHRFKCLRRPQADETYAKVLELGLITLLYGLSTEWEKPSWRKV